VRILLVGALSWNPERMRSLADRGHQLWGLWSRSMGWDQGPYPMLDGAVERITLDDAARTILEQQIECVLALFQVYEPALWAPAADGVDVDVWTLLRALLDDRAQGRIDVPFVFQWGFDVHTLDGAVVRALDGHIFCNQEQVAYWTSSPADGGRGLDLFATAPVTAVLDGDRPKLEFMGDDFAEPLSASTGELHTACIGRPLGVDVRALAARGIHLHLYGNGFDDVARLVASDLRRRPTARDLQRIREHVHIHPSRQTGRVSWAAAQAEKAQWVHEFSRYDAGWSYIGTPYPWTSLEDRAAIPNRLSTYLLAGLPVITDCRPGLYRYDELHRLGVDIELVDGDHDRLADALTAEVRSREKRRRARAARAAYSFDASIDELVGILQRARRQYLARPDADRRKPITEDGRPIIELMFRPGGPRWMSTRPGRVVRKVREKTLDRARERRTQHLARTLGAGTARR
jgi:hypothetical protein